MICAADAAAAAKSLQSRPTLGNPIDGSPPGSPIPGILQARILEWVAISFSRVICAHLYNYLLFILYILRRLDSKASSKSFGNIRNVLAMQMIIS